jgi:hypothetical protein
MRWGAAVTRLNEAIGQASGLFLEALRITRVSATLIACALALVACGGSESGPSSGPVGPTPQATSCPHGPERDGPYSRVMVAGESSAQGIIDPSVEYPAGAAEGFMTYTAVPSPARVHIAIATSDDNGATWRHAGDVTEARPATITTTDTSVCGAPSCQGTIAHESSSLVLDPSDPDPARRFKVFVHTYFFGTAQQFLIGYVAMYTAGAVEGPWAETKLFGWPSSSPLSTADVAYDVTTDPALSGLHGCLLVGEPGALVRSPGTIDLALSCVTSGGTDIRLLRSGDHGRRWSFVGTLLTIQDAAALGATSSEITGADLFRANGAFHLIATPVGPVDFPDGRDNGYRGCIVVSVADLETGQVDRCENAPVVEASYLGQPGQFVGACSTDAGATASGMLIPVPDLTFTSASPYQLFASGPPVP